MSLPWLLSDIACEGGSETSVMRPWQTRPLACILDLVSAMSMVVTLRGRESALLPSEFVVSIYWMMMLAVTICTLVRSGQASKSRAV